MIKNYKKKTKTNKNLCTLKFNIWQLCLKIVSASSCQYLHNNNNIQQLAITITCMVGGIIDKFEETIG